MHTINPIINRYRYIYIHTCLNSPLYIMLGYGNLAPDTNWSRVFTIFYALIGIPINGILLTNLSDFFSSKVINTCN